MFLILDNGTEDLGNRGVIPGVFFNSLPDINNDGIEHSISAPIEIVAAEVAYRRKIYFSIPNPPSCKGLELLGNTIFGCSPVI